MQRFHRHTENAQKAFLERFSSVRHTEICLWERKCNSRAVSMLKIHSGNDCSAESVITIPQCRLHLHHQNSDWINVEMNDVSTLHKWYYATHLSTFLSPECTFRYCEPNPVFRWKPFRFVSHPYSLRRNETIEPSAASPCKKRTEAFLEHFFRV